MFSDRPCLDLFVLFSKPFFKMTRRFAKRQCGVSLSTHSTSVLLYSAKRSLREPSFSYPSLLAPQQRTVGAFHKYLWVQALVVSTDRPSGLMIQASYAHCLLI